MAPKRKKKITSQLGTAVAIWCFSTTDRSTAELILILQRSWTLNDFTYT